MSLSQVAKFTIGNWRRRQPFAERRRRRRLQQWRR
jgi:hypothetical protein